jgi:hypothetical protein
VGINFNKPTLLFAGANEQSQVVRVSARPREFGCFAIFRGVRVGRLCAHSARINSTRNPCAAVRAADNGR